jgi:hypothetical protein
MKRSLILVVLLLCAGFGLAAEDTVPSAVDSVEPETRTCPVEDLAKDVKGKPPKPEPPACCDPALEPGTNGNPLCFEGHTCCSDGRWSCNQPDGSPSCDPGQVCDAGCASSGDACSADADCCSGKCKGGRCR